MKFIRINNEWLTDTNEGNLFVRIGTEGFTIYCVLLYIKGNKDKFQTSIKEIQNILCRNYDKRPIINYSKNKSNYINVIKEVRTIKKYIKLLIRENLIEIEDGLEKVNEIKITDYMIINMVNLEYKKGFASIACDLVLDKIHKIGHIGFSLLYILTSLFDKNFANPSEKFLGNVVKRDKNTVRAYLYLLKEYKLIKIFPQSPVLLGVDKNGNSIYQYVPNHYIVENKLSGNEYYINENKYKNKKKIYNKEELRIQDDTNETNILKTMPYNEYLQTEHWKNVRKKALIRANYKCQLCSSKENLQVHHNTYENRGIEKDEDLIVLCEDCHKKFHEK